MNNRNFFDIPALFVLKTRKSRTGKFKITLHTYLNSILNLLVIFLATQIKKNRKEFPTFSVILYPIFFYTNHEILFKKSYQMRSPDDDDEVHNSISKLLWLRQPLSAHLSSLFVRSAFWWELIWNSNVVGVTKIIFNVVPIPRISLDHNKTQNSAPKIQKT